MTVSTIEPILITGNGIRETIRGFLNLALGKRIIDVVTVVMSGMASVDLGGRLLGLDPSSHSKLMKWTLQAGTGAVFVQGATRFATGVKQRFVKEILAGAFETALGITGTIVTFGLEAKVIVAAHHASLIFFSSAFITKLGLSDLFKGRIQPGICKVIAGLSGIVFSGYYAYCCSIPQEEMLPSLHPDHIAFLENHKTEIERMYTSRTSIGDWKILGGGFSKTAFIHPKFPGMLIKIPNDQTGFRGRTGEDDMRLHYENLLQMREIATSYNSIVLPDSHLYPTQKGSVIVEQMLDLVADSTVPNGKMKQIALTQLDEFQQETGLCDIILKKNHNAGFIKQDSYSYPKIGIFDFDCRHPWNAPFSILKEENLVFIYAWAAGAITTGMTWVAKNIRVIEPSTIVTLAVGAGAIAAIYGECHNRIIPTDSILDLTSLAMTTTSIATVIVSTAIVKTYSAVKGFLERWIAPYFP